MIPGDVAVVGGRVLRGLGDVTSDLTALDSRGLWAVMIPFSGSPVCARFTHASAAPAPPAAPGNQPPPRAAVPWPSSLDRDEFCARVTTIREAIASGDVYQVNLCRRVSAPWPGELDIVDLGRLLAQHHPAPHAAVLRLPSAGVYVASASPERFLRRDGSMVESRPIKGTAVEAGDLLAKDVAENVMIVDLVRNDLGRVCEYGSIAVDELCGVEPHPGLAHLVSTVRGQLRPGTGWADLLEATFPPGSVTGAPKLAALDLIRRLEPVDRGVYCGAIGWVDADARRGDMNVAIRTFWLEDERLCFGTGGGITWDSVPQAEWEETELKASRLVPLAGSLVGGMPGAEGRVPVGNLSYG